MEPFTAAAISCPGASGERHPIIKGPPHAVTLDTDDTVDVVHGHQQLSLFNSHYDKRCFLPNLCTMTRAG
jgi:hypothetical protein